MRKVFQFIILALSISTFSLIGMGINHASAATFDQKEQLPYQQVLERVNSEYQLNLEFIPVDPNKGSVEEYEQVTRKVAKEQRELLNYIKMKTVSKDNLRALSVTPNSGTSKTATKAVWGFENYFTIKATYTDYGSTLSNIRNASLGETLTAGLTNTYLTDISSPKYSIIDNGRTGTVKYTATLHYDSVYGYKNTALYAEFYAK
jgi:hypothetical protein